MTLMKKIKDDWGSVPHFCKLNSINYNTFRQVVYGLGTSSKIVNVLIKHNYIQSADELPKKEKKCA